MKTLTTPMTADQLMKLRQQVEKTRQQQHQAEGALAEVMKQLNTQHGCSTIKAAQGMLKTLEQQEQEAQQELEKEMEAFESDFGDSLSV